MSNFKLTFTLKQHTPIIHFQYFLSGATLRTTELKSALDKFLIGKYCNCWSSDETIRLKKVIECDKLKSFLKHLADPKKPAFDYDVEVVYPENSKIITNVGHGFKRGESFFGNQMNKDSYLDKEKYKYQIIEKELIQLTIKSPFNGLLDLIDDIIGEFFLLKNFGTRQSKGYGNFFPVEKYKFLKEQNILPYYFDYDKSKMEYKFYNRHKTVTKYYSLNEIITLFYNTLRSGINEKNHRRDTVFYFKSFMWAYAKSKGEQWDKKTIKSKYLNGIMRSEITKWNAYDDSTPLGYNDKKNNEQRHLWRDILGLSSNEKAGSWQLTKEHTETDKTKKITRFKSPIIFKPFMVGEDKYRVLFGVDPVLKNAFKNNETGNDECLPTEIKILKSEFAVKYRGNGGLKLLYPKAFDFDEFIKFSIDKYNDKWVDSYYHDHEKYKILNAIYTQLKKQI